MRFRGEIICLAKIYVSSVECIKSFGNGDFSMMLKFKNTFPK